MMRGWIVILAAALGLLLVAWLTSSVPAPPLYDGIQLPPGPYRYLQPPLGQPHSAKQPTSAHLRLNLSTASSPYDVVSTSEQPPQAELILEQNAIRFPRPPALITFTIRPIVPPVQPVDAAIDGNVYRFQASANSGANLTFRKNKAGIDLRATGFHSAPIIAQYIGGRWIRYRTGQFLGMPIYTANVRSLGDFALIVSGKGALAPGGFSLLPLVVIGALIVGLAVVGLFLVRIARQGADVDSAA